ncbi:tripartite ATP-independent transporter DctP family solute receptor [Natronocella acetinitrilica]|uniref:Tripartite ATP-independent transporter DctP family solute receptor n=1 Tax=Natronocella acetinitrilica TaxID=414046 RepID=A0AAE3KG76_9GAMM|nr:TRAP transporter substrate-binding protein [Natronocella acetinitrilica]MCP1674917.1 tripartite ATP-independent transporter DctP family solute receptor [Natronocella acetinitrilica]
MVLLRVFSLALALALLSAPLQAREITFGHVGGPDSLFADSAEHFAALANERLPEPYRVEVYGSSQLGNDQELLQRLRLGTVDFALPSTIMSSVADEFGIFELPYLVKNREHMARIEEEIFWPTLAPIAEQNGYRILAVWENGFRHITNNRRAIERPEDLRGIKLRTPRGAWRVRMFEEYGAEPSPMALSEVFMALQTGVMDGQENPLAQIAGQRFQEVQRYLSLTGHVYTPAYIAAGRRFERLPEEIQEILIQAAVDTQEFVYSHAAELDRDLIGVIESAGTQVNEVDTNAFIDASQPVYEAFAREVSGSQELIDRIMALGEDL